MALPKRVLVKSMVNGVVHSYYTDQDTADMMLARGDATPANDGTRTIHLRHTFARGNVKHWRKVTNRSTHGAALYSTMQLVSGCQEGRNTGGRRRG